MGLRWGIGRPNKVIWWREREGRERFQRVSWQAPTGTPEGIRESWPRCTVNEVRSTGRFERGDGLIRNVLTIGAERGFLGG